MTQQEFADHVKMIGEIASKLLSEAKTEQERQAIVVNQNEAIKRLLEKLDD